jgi:hypothetical protein
MPATFAFSPRWREELVCSGAGGRFALEATMGGELTAYLPTEAAWKERGPDWTRELWPVLHQDLMAWCKANRARLVVDAGASIFPAGDE